MVTSPKASTNMASRSFLITTNAPAPDHDPVQPGDAARAAGSYTIPVLWVSLFSAGDVVQRALRPDGNRPAETYPLLVAATAAARATFARRKPHLARLLPPTLAPMLDEFALLLDQVEEEYIKLETYEIWMMDEDDFRDYLQALQDLMEAIETMRPEAMTTFLEERQIGKDPKAQTGYRNTNATMLRGHRYRKPVPWTD